MKKTLPIIAVALVFLIGLWILSYPLISSVINNMQSRNDEGVYYQKAEKMGDAKMTAMIKKAKDYNKHLYGKAIITDPFDVEAYNKMNKEYRAILSTDPKGTIGYVRIPKIDVSLPIYHGTDDKTLAQGAGHLENTSIPVGGKGTHSVISAHSAFPGQTFFDYLTELEKGDEFYIKVLNRTLKYKVDQIKVVLPENTSDLHIDPEKDYVRGERVPYSEKEELSVTTVTAGDQAVYFLGYKIPYVVAGIVIAGFVLIVVLSVVLIAKRRKRRAENEP